MISLAFRASNRAWVVLSARDVSPRSLSFIIHYVSPGGPPSPAPPVRSTLSSFINRYERSRYCIMRRAEEIAYKFLNAF